MGIEPQDKPGEVVKLQRAVVLAAVLWVVGLLIIHGGLGQTPIALVGMLCVLGATSATVKALHHLVTKRIVKIALVLLSVPLLGYGFLCFCVLVLFFVWPPVDAYLHSVRFESVAWKTKSMDGAFRWPTRLRMIDDLVKKDLLSGIDRSRVDETLGPPDDASRFSNWDLVYRLGPQRGPISIDSEWLVLRFDESGRIAESRVVHSSELVCSRSTEECIEFCGHSPEEWNLSCLGFD